MIALPFLTRTTALIAPVTPDPARDEWLTEQIADYRQGPLGYLPEPTTTGLPSGHRTSKEDA